jgi:hypothetical protein
MRRLLVILAALAIAPVANAESYPPIKHPVRAAAGYQAWLNEAYDAKYRWKVTTTKSEPARRQSRSSEPELSVLASFEARTEARTR